MRSDADRIAQAASSLALTSDEAQASDIADRWARVAASASSLDAWVVRERRSAGLTFGETAILTDASPLLDDLYWEAAEIARRVGTSSADQAVLAARAQSVVRTASAVARLIDPLTACREAERFVSYSPHPACETLDPEFQYAMSGACVQ
ncbi:MAG: hypothetical protein KDC27_07660 [Acidobacteria bacterium]|nr:hypothetical protein [Acidobacteriota bacterium]